MLPARPFNIRRETPITWRVPRGLERVFAGNKHASEIMVLSATQTSDQNSREGFQQSDAIIGYLVHQLNRSRTPEVVFCSPFKLGDAGSPRRDQHTQPPSSAGFALWGVTGI